MERKLPLSCPPTVAAARITSVCLRNRGNGIARSCVTASQTGPSLETKSNASDPFVEQPKRGRLRV